MDGLVEAIEFEGLTRRPSYSLSPILPPRPLACRNGIEMVSPSAIVSRPGGAHEVSGIGLTHSAYFVRCSQPLTSCVAGCARLTTPSVVPAQTTCNESSVAPLRS